MAPALAAAHEAYGDRARVVLVYIAEAHAADVWPINSRVCSGPGNRVCAPRSLQQRRITAREMLRALDLTPLRSNTYVDGMDDAFLHAFAAWPTRLYGIGADGRSIERIAQPQDAAFDVGEMLAWLHDAVDRQEAQLDV